MNTTSERKPISIGVMIGDVSYDFSAELMSGILDTAEKEGVQILYMMGMPRHAGSTGLGSALKTAYHHNIIYDYAYLFGADAYILSCGSLSGFESENAYQQFLKRFDDCLYVVLQEQIECCDERKSCITVNNYNSFCESVEHLILVHHRRRICFLAGVKGHPDVKDRMRAYLDTMRKYGLTVTDSMIAYGDFSEFSDQQVSQLIDGNPDIDAIVFCNDEMARGGYRVCAKRGLSIGKDISFTGFDNFSTSRSLLPPLTTISQNVYHMGEMAVLQAIDHVNGKPVNSAVLETKLYIRRSCGCVPDTVCGLFAPDEKTGSIRKEEVLRRISADLKECYADSERKRSDQMIDQLMGYIDEIIADEEELADKYRLADWIHSFAEQYAGTTFHLAIRLNDYIVQMPVESLRVPFVRNLHDTLSFVYGFLFSYRARMIEKSLVDFRAQSWFIPEFIRDLVDSDMDDESVFFNVVKRLRGINIESIYICLLPEAQPLLNTDIQNLPNKLLLAAYDDCTTAKTYPRTQMPVIDSQHSLRSLPGLNSATHLMSFSIFSGNIQYGILLCKVDMSKSSLLHVIGLQLGILINFLDLKRKEKLIGDELENITERNQILNFLSEYDPLCNILNRRGFIEQAIHLNRENTGKSAICVFMDLDHLKEINDTFGHSAGDFALSAVSDILKKTVRQNDLIARIGGDEFIGMFITDRSDFDEMYRIRVRQAFEEFNSASSEPFYVEASMGIAHFICDHNLEISNIVNQADQYLYEQKKSKRPTALK